MYVSLLQGYCEGNKMTIEQDEFRLCKKLKGKAFAYSLIMGVTILSTISAVETIRSINNGKLVSEYIQGIINPV